APVPPRWVSPEELLLTVDGRFRVLRPGRDTGEEIPFSAAMTVDRPAYRVKSYDLARTAARPVRGIHLPALSPDGRRIAFAALNSLWLHDVAGGTPRRITRAAPTRYLLGPVWARDGRSLLYTDDRDGLHAVRRHDLASGSETVLA